MAAKILWLSLIVSSRICLSVGERVDVTVPPLSVLGDRTFLNSSISTSGTSVSHLFMSLFAYRGKGKDNSRGVHTGLPKGGRMAKLSQGLELQGAS